MGYEARITNYELKVTDKKRLLKTLTEKLNRYYNLDEFCGNLEDVMRFYCCAEDTMTIDTEGHVDDFYVCAKYHEDDWEVIAPYLSGYIEWIGDDDCVWRDYFRNGEMETESPEVIWPSDYFYIEKWCDEDITSQIRGFDIAEDDPFFDEILNEAKIRVACCFDDKSCRNEQIEQVVANIIDNIYPTSCERGDLLYWPL